MGELILYKEKFIKMEISMMQEPLRGDQIELNGVLVSKQMLFRTTLNKEAPSLLNGMQTSQISEKEKVALLYDVYKESSNLETTEDQKENVLVSVFSCLPMILPTHTYYLIWKILVVIVVLLLFFSIPIDWAYGSEMWNFIPRWSMIMTIGLMMLILFLDMILEFVTAFYKHGNLITIRSRIVQNYIDTYFFYDLIAYLGFLIRFMSQTNDLRVFYLLFYFKWPSMSKIDLQFEEVILLYRKTRTCYNFCKVIAILQFAFVLFACGFFAIGFAANNAGLNTWLQNDGNFGVILDRTIQDQLFFSFYFSMGTMTTTMGYGDITPLNIYECSFCLSGIMFAVIIFAIMVNSLFKIIEEYNVNPVRIYQQRVAINRFMRSKEVPEALRERVRQYLNEHWYEEGTRNIQTEQVILDELAPELRQELMLNSYGKLLIEVPLLYQTFSLLFRKELSLKVQEVNFATGEFIFQRFDPVDDFSIYYIMMGSIAINHCSDQLNKLKKKDSFGEWSFITGMDRKASAVALTYSSFYRISRADFLALLNNFITDYEAFWMIRDKIIFEKQIGILGSCWTCGSPQHYSTECDQTHYIPNIQDLLLLNNIAQQQQRRKRKRNPGLEWKTLRDCYKLKFQEQDNFKKSRLSMSVVEYNAEPNTQIQEFDKPYEFQSYFQDGNYVRNSEFLQVSPLKKNRNYRQTISVAPTDYQYAIDKKY